MLLLIRQKDIPSGYFKMLHTNSAYCHPVGKKNKKTTSKQNHVFFNVTVLFNITKYVSSHADEAVARHWPRYLFVFGLVASSFPSFPPPKKKKISAKSEDYGNWRLGKHLLELF